MSGQLIEVIPALVQFFKKSVFMENAEVSEDKELKGLIGDVAEVLAVPHLHESVEAVRVVATVLGWWASWLEGCDCHEDILIKEKTYSKRAKRMRDLGMKNGKCFWKGRRAIKMAAGSFV